MAWTRTIELNTFLGSELVSAETNYGEGKILLSFPNGLIEITALPRGGALQIRVEQNCEKLFEV
jgi:hypothetical protein